MSDKEELIAAYRKKIADLPEAGGYAEVTLVHKGIGYKIGQRAANPYDAFAALAYTVSFMQRELGLATEPAVPASTSTTATASGGASVPAGANGNGHQPGTETIPVEVIKLGQGGEHPYWLVKGGKWKKHGVICWPEVIEGRGWTLDPFAENRLPGDWLAVCQMKGTGQPDKVTDFIPAKS